jgi:hypothetical protein
MSLTLKSIEPFGRGFMTVVYEVQHWTPGADGTCLSQDMTLTVSPVKTTAVLNVSDCDAKTPDEALKRMSVWLRRLADGIDEHKDSINLPI